AMSRLPVDMLAGGDRLFNEYEGAFVENFVAQQLTAHFQQPLYYWRSKGGKAELESIGISFFYQYDNQRIWTSIFYLLIM
ncbi:MAG: DUF4143 domain-containing protein, partial [Bacteroides sp.]|nr:DUF4143 domain-containing protein [Bacteroides sp.]